MWSLTDWNIIRCASYKATSPVQNFIYAFINNLLYASQSYVLRCKCVGSKDSSWGRMKCITFCDRDRTQCPSMLKEQNDYSGWQFLEDYLYWEGHWTGKGGWTARQARALSTSDGKTMGTKQIHTIQKTYYLEARVYHAEMCLTEHHEGEWQWAHPPGYILLLVSGL